MLKKAGSKSKVSRAFVYKWHRRFLEGRDSVLDDERAGRKRIISENLVERISNVMERDGRVTVAELASMFDISSGTAFTILSQHLDMKRVSARWIPKLLTDEDKTKRLQLSRAFLRRYSNEDNFLQRIVTTDETWLFHYDPETKQQSSAWKRKSSPPPLKAKVRKSARKNMFIFFMDIRGMLLVHAVPEGQTVNAEYYAQVIRRYLVNAIRKKRPDKQIEEFLLHQDNAPAHRADTTMLELDLRVIHAPYSPDLAPMDFKVFPTMKAELRGKKFKNTEEQSYATRTIVSRFDDKWYRDTFSEWVRRHRLCVKCRGEYFEKL
ncbi:histone-lysine N-methyltransferase SETMAR-like [Saccostrea cucullata]|uniref:histone-lysine N-methyltransferase SETMAR-like n=1 Tax=Saccostrea cuccullata TaxID=36930 RepID=UPI002ED4BF42